MIYHVHKSYEMREDDFNNTWDRVIYLRQKALKELENKRDYYEGVARFDVRLGYDGSTYYKTDKPTHTFGFNSLGTKLDDVQKIIQDIHNALEEHGSEAIDIIFNNKIYEDSKGIIVVLHSNNVIEHVLYYTEYFEKVVTGGYKYKTVEHFSKIEDILQIALELDYKTSDKEKFMFSGYSINGEKQEVRLFLRDCLDKKIPTNYSYDDVKTQEEKEEEQARQRQEQARQRQEQARQQQQQQDDLLKTLLEQQQQFQQQMMAMMVMYQQMQQQEQEEEFEDDDE